MTSYSTVKGSDIMLFTYTSEGYQSIAHGTSHSLSLSADTEDINDKDCSIYGKTEVNKINWEIQADHMYTTSDYDKLFQTMTYMKPITVVFGLKADSDTQEVNKDSAGYWTNGSYIYGGNAIITSLDWNADAGSRSTISVTLQGQGAITKGEQTDPIAFPTTSA